MNCLHWINSHGIETGAAYMLFTAIVNALPPCTTASSPLYQFIYKLLSTLNVDFKTVMNRTPTPGAVAAVEGNGSK